MDPLTRERNAMHLAYLELILATNGADLRELVRSADALEDSIEALCDRARLVLSSGRSSARALGHISPREPGSEPDRAK